MHAMPLIEVTLHMQGDKTLDGQSCIEPVAINLHDRNNRECKCNTSQQKSRYDLDHPLGACNCRNLW